MIPNRTLVVLRIYLIFSLLSLFSQGTLYAQDVNDFGHKEMPQAQKNHPMKNSWGQWEQRRKERTEKLLMEMANRLEIKASQQMQWESFANAFREMRSSPKDAEAGHFGRADWGAAKPELPLMNAGEMAKLMAEKMSARATKMTNLANQLIELQKVLSADQQKTLNQMTTTWMHKRFEHHRMHGFRHMQGMLGMSGMQGMNGSHY
jgi:hypothetical protein